MRDDFDHLVAEAHDLGQATLHARIEGTPDLLGSDACFEAATEALVESTRSARELGGACYFVQKGGAVVLVGLSRRAQGHGDHVTVQPSWGSVLWHSHPGQQLSLAAFSTPDIEGARAAGKPLLVIGYRTASPDVLGLTAVADLVRGRDDPLTDRLLHMGVAAQVCWPSGEIRPVERYRRDPANDALGKLSFHVDSALGSASRAITASPLGPLSNKLAATLRGALTRATRRPR
jgi:hypothetical protein